MTRHLIAPLVALAMATSACGERAVEEVATTAAVPVTVEVAHVDALERTLGVTGVVTPAPGGELTVTSPAAGRIAELPRAEGDAVHVGDLLARFDIPSLGADTAARNAEADQARARVTTTRAAVTRLSGLLERGIAAARDVEEARRDQADAEAALGQAESAVSAARSLQSRAEVRATFDGVVAKRWHHPGDLVDASASDPVLRVINPRSLQIVAGVPIAEIGHVTIGATGRVTGPGTDEPEDARVITRPASVDPGQVLADVRLAFASPTTLPAGAAVNVDIVLQHVNAALIVPRAALVEDDDKTFVYVVGADNIAHRKAVTVGLTATDRIEITKGISANDRVVVRGQDELPDGAAVTVTK